MNLNQAINTPSQLAPKDSSSGEFTSVVFTGDFSNELIAGVKALGLDIEVISNLSANRSYVSGIEIDDDGKYKAIHDPYGLGAAFGY